MTATNPPAAPQPSVTSATDTFPMPKPAPASYTVPDVAALARLSESHIRRLADKGRIPGRLKGVGRRVRFGKKAVDAWLSGEGSVN
jgi:excisionase family DNA binding protein